MDKKFLIWKNPWQAIVVTVLVLILLGVINIFSAKGVYDLVNKQIFFAVVAAFVAGGMTLVGYKNLLHEYLLIFLVVVLTGALYLVYKTPDDQIINGAKRWLFIGGLTVQPSEFVKLLIIMVGAKYLGPFLDEDRETPCRKLKYWYLALVGCFFAWVVRLQPDMGTAAIIFGIMLMMYCFAGLRPFFITTVLGGGALLLGIFAITASYRMERLRAWIDPWSERMGDGFQAVQSFIAIGSGGLVGNGWGQGVAKLILPERHTDFALAIYCSETGFLGFLFLVLVVLVLSSALFRIAINAKNGTGFLLVAGINFLLVGQGIANMGMVCGILPVIGVPFPFISYGGSSLTMAIICLGFVYCVSKDNEYGRWGPLLAPDGRREELHLVSRRESGHEE